MDDFDSAVWDNQHDFEKHIDTLTGTGNRICGNGRIWVSSQAIYICDIPTLHFKNSTFISFFDVY